MTIASALLVFLAVRVVFFSLKIPRDFLSRAPKARSAQQFSQRPLLGRWSPSAVKRLRALADQGPDAVLPRPDRSSHRPAPSQRYPALGAGGPALVAPLAVVEAAPDIGAFSAGVELGIFTALFTISSLLVVNWIVKTMRSSK